MIRDHKPTVLADTPLIPKPTTSSSEDNSRITAKLPSGESIEVLLHGATIISWKDSAGNEKLWLSDAAILNGAKPVRGGIPLVFPVFGSDPNHEATKGLPSHGFARNFKWELLGESKNEEEDGSVSLDFGLTSASLDEKTRQLWPYEFSLVYTVSLHKNTLRTGILINNTGSVPFECQALLHSYFRVNDISHVKISGLEGATYLDKVDSSQSKTQSEVITFEGETDSVYNPAAHFGPISIVDTSVGGEVVSIGVESFEDVVVWNPWIEKAAIMGDFEPKDGWKKMVCVEAGTVRSWQKLEAGETYMGSQTLTSS